ncbi:tyrosine-type recombinase/integrase [Paenibacillus xylaniclasticus]|uniref:tyrosine-type recombinase/integrase n=1 Tax=Paenibacillus xylaniclasticus TaxID=588083 RepID=UPI00175FE0F4|nr:MULTISPECIES: tyrosine-type recombinase/integrase [Paenibacillus]GFN30436.1 tyrosine recombinase XerC [Paenibacillus curdlanolyticus]
MSRLMKVKKVAPTSLDEALIQFLNWKKANGISDQTILDYTTHVNLLFKRFPSAKDSYELLQQSVYEHLGQEKIKPATYNNRLVYLRSFFEWCVEQEVLSENPLAKFKKHKDEGKVVNIDENVLTDLIQLPNKNTYAGLRDYALFLVFLDCGIRPKEAFSLMESDFNSKSCELFVDKEKAKTRMSRTLHITPQTSKAIDDMLAVRPKEWKAKAPLFCTYEGNAMNRHSWGDRVEMYCKKLGTKFHPYALRHAFSIMFLRGKGNAFALQMMLGHVDMTMTKRYVRLTTGDVKEQHAMASPVNRIAPQNKRLRGLGKK